MRPIDVTVKSLLFRDYKQFKDERKTWVETIWNFLKAINLTNKIFLNWTEWNYKIHVTVSQLIEIMVWWRW